MFNDSNDQISCRQEQRKYCRPERATNPIGISLLSLKYSNFLFYLTYAMVIVDSHGTLTLTFPLRSDGNGDWITGGPFPLPVCPLLDLPVNIITSAPRTV